MGKRYNQDKDAILDYKFDWAALSNGTGSEDWLLPGETITSHAVTALTGVTVDSSALADTDTSVVAWLSVYGTVGQSYDVVCHITTTATRQDDRTITIRVVEK